MLLDRYNNISQDLSSKAKEFAAEVGDSDQKKILEAIKENTQLQLNINEIAKDLTIDPTNQANLKSISKAIDSCDQNWGLIAASRFKNDPIFDKMIESFVAISAKIILDIKMENIDDAKKGHDSWLNENDKLKKRALEYFAKTDIPSNRIKISSLLNTIEEQKSAVEENLTSLYDNPADGNTLNDLSNTFKSISKNYAQIAGQNAQDGKSLQLIQREIDEAAKKIVESIKNKDAPCTRVAGIDYNSLATQFKHNAQLISSQTSAINQEAFNEKMSTLEKVQDDITSQVTDSIQNMKSGSEVSQKEKNRFNRDISYAAALRVAIQVDLSKSLVGLTLSTTNELSDHLKQETAFGNLFASATNGKSTPSSLEAPIKRFKTSSKKLSDILNIAIGFKEHDQKVVQSLSECLQRLQKLEPSIVTSLQALSVNPKDVGANEVTTGLITIWEELIKQTTDCLIGSNGVFNAVEIIDGACIFELM